MMREEIRRGYKQTEVGVIPEEWGAPKIEAILEEISMGPFGSDIKVSNFISAGVPVLNGSNVSSQRLKDRFENFVSHSKAKDLKKAVARRGDVVVTHRGTIGQIAYIPNDSEFERYVVSQSQFRAKFCSKSVIPEWVVLYFHSELGKRRLLDGKGHTGVPAISAPTKTFRQLSIPIPPLPEQFAIAAALADADALIEALEGMITKKRDLKQAAMQHLLTGKTRLPGFTGEWQVKRLGELAFLHKGQVVPGSQPGALFCHYSLPAFDDGRMPVLENGSEIGSNKFTVPSNSVLVSKLNPRIPRVWSLSSVPDNSVASTEFLVLMPKENIGLGFLSVLCGSTMFCEKMENAVSGTTGSHQRVAPKDAIRLEVDFPTDVNEQTAIAEVLFDMDADLTALKAQAAKVRSVKQGMMQELLTGRVRLI